MSFESGEEHYQPEEENQPNDYVHDSDSNDEPDNIPNYDTEIDSPRYSDKVHLL
jgi:hypothetical protein